MMIIRAEGDGVKRERAVAINRVTAKRRLEIPSPITRTVGPRAPGVRPIVTNCVAISPLSRRAEVLVSAVRC
jgi:hypothetical protein